MALSYAQITTRVLQWLQDTAIATYDATETGNAIEDELKRLSDKTPLLVDVVFQIESREGKDDAGTASKLTDSSKSQFLTADATNEKVVHNLTDDTWATATARDSASVLSLSRDIMASGDEYEIYNKRCKNKRQIYIGDMAPFLWIESVEYPIGTEQKFIRVSQDVIELDVSDSAIEDSDSTLDPLNPIDVLVKFAVPHVLCQLTDLAGEVDLVAGYAAGLTTIHVDGLGATEVIEIGEMFTLENQRTTYTITAQTTLASNEGDITFYPPLEAALIDNDDITFVKSSLSPKLEGILTRMVVSHCIQSDLMRFAKSGQPLVANYQAVINGNPLLNFAAIERELDSMIQKRPARNLSGIVV